MVTAAFTAAAEITDDSVLLPDAEWFADPGFEGPTPLTVTSDGRVLGHLATWGTCHVGFDGKCVEPPKSQANYAYFRTGEVETAEGERIAVGQITMDTGHAQKMDAPLVAIGHYDDTGLAVADVAAGEDQWGIWVAGAMRPGVDETKARALQATGSLSGDWRRIGGHLELVAALAVNVPGFPIPRIELAASGDMELSLVAAGDRDPRPQRPESRPGGHRRVGPPRPARGRQGAQGTGAAPDRRDQRDARRRADRRRSVGSPPWPVDVARRRSTW